MGKGFEFHFDENALKREIDKALRAATPKIQNHLDAVFDGYYERSENELSRGIVDAFKREGIDLTPAEAANYAAEMKAGNRVILKFAGVQT